MGVQCQLLLATDGKRARPMEGVQPMSKQISRNNETGSSDGIRIAGQRIDP